MSGKSGKVSLQIFLETEGLNVMIQIDSDSIDFALGNEKEGWLKGGWGVSGEEVWSGYWSSMHRRRLEMEVPNGGSP